MIRPSNSRSPELRWPQSAAASWFAACTLLVLLTGCSRVKELMEDDQPSAEADSVTAVADDIRQARVYRVPAATATQSDSFVARVEAAQSIDLAFEVAGTLVELPIREGQTIPQGKLVARLDQTHFLLAVEEAEVALRLRSNDHKRKASLLARRGISQSAVDDALASADLAAVRLRQARESLRETRLTAPFDAYVAQRNVDNHTNIQAAVPVVRLFDLSKLRLRANVPEALLATMSQEDVASTNASFSFAPDQSFPVQYLEHRGEASKVAQTYEVIFELDPPQGINLLPGMTATVHLERRSDSGALRAFEIPSSALTTSPNNALGVWVLNEASGRVQWQTVTAQPGSAGMMRITQGLGGNELVVTTGTALLRTDMRIKPLAGNQAQ